MFKRPIVSSHKNNNNSELIAHYGKKTQRCHPSPTTKHIRIQIADPLAVVSNSSVPDPNW